MKRIIPLAILSFSLASNLLAAPFMAIGAGAELFITGTVGVRADDNIFLTASEEDDIIFDVNPGLELTFGKNAQLKGAITLQESFTSYMDNDLLNSNLFSSSFSAAFDDGKLKLNAQFGFSELNQNNADVRPPVNGLTRRDVTTTGVNGEVEISPLTAIGGGLTYSRDNYITAGFTDSESLSVPLNFYYEMSPKVDLSFSYRYRTTEVDILGNDSDDHSFLIGARGDFSPKLTGRFGFGVTRREIKAGTERDLFAVDISFAYELSPKTSVQAGLSHDFGTSPQGAQQKNFTANVGVTNKLSEFWSLNAGVSYRRIDYLTRIDDFYEGNLGAAYTFNSNIRIIGSYVYRTYESALAGSDFTNNVFSLAASLRY